MEFNLSGFFTRVGIDVLNLNDLRNVLDDFNYSIELINFNDIDNFLLEEFSEFIVHFVIEFRILTGKLLHLDSQHVHQVLSSGILNWYFHSSFTESFKVNDIACQFEDR